jgi:thioredoxin-like negative regulator of GroEL
MKPDWDKLGSEFSDSKTVLIGDVDCTVEKALCSKYGVKGFPTIKVFNDGSEEVYEGGRSYDDLKKFADENLGPSCNSDNKDLCSEEQLKELTELEGLGADVVAERIAAAEKDLADANEEFDTALKALQETYEKISKEKEAKVAAAKAPLGMLRKVKFA